MQKKACSEIILISAVLTGCVSTIDTTDLEVVPSNETLMALEADNIQNIQDKRTEYRILKFQPLNKKEKCELSYFTSDDTLMSPDNEYFWDGECSNGKADGLGRLFIKTKSKETEQLIEYTNNQSNLNIYWLNDRKNSKTYFGHSEIDLDEKTQFGYFRTVEAIKRSGDTFFVDLLETRDVTYIYKYNQDSSVEEFTKAYCANENGSNLCFNITTLLKPELERISFSTSQDNGKTKEVGYIHEVNPNNPEQKAVRMITEKGTVTTKNEEFPSEYVTYIREINNEIKNRVSYVPDSVELAENKLAEYKAKVCSVSDVDFMPQEKYRKICE